ncbi:hypothetical protein FPRO04_13309 [Fusarium proliferatum]|nr:hypothetical protein FPRO04_13309 [Fusarium proliferatum]
MPSLYFSDLTRLCRRERHALSRGVRRRRAHTHSFAPCTVVTLRRIRPTILNFRIFLDKKGAETRHWLMVGEKLIWELRHGSTEEFEDHWQEDEGFQKLLDGYYSAVYERLRVDREIQSDNATTFNQCFDALRSFFDEYSDEFDNVSLDIVTLLKVDGVKIPRPDVGIWQEEWKRMTTKYSPFPGNQDYDYETIIAQRARSKTTVGVATVEEATAQDARATPEADAVTTDNDEVTTDDNIVITGIVRVTTEWNQTLAEDSMLTTEKPTSSDTTHKKGEDTKAPTSERMYANFLLEHDLVAGLFFAKGKPGEAEETRLAQEAGEEEVRRQEGLRRDPPLFPNGWLEQSRYSFDEIQIFDYDESLEMCNDRYFQIVHLATQLTDVFFDVDTDKAGCHHFSVPGISSVPQLGPTKTMPEIIERDSGLRVVFVDPSFYAVKLKEEEMRKEKERQNEEKRAEAAPGAAAIVDTETEGNAEDAHDFRPLCDVDVVNWVLGMFMLVFNCVIGLARLRNLGSGTDPTGALSIIAENGNDDDATSTVELELRKATRTAKTIAAVEELFSTDDYEPAESEAWTTLPVQGVNDLEHTKGSNAGPDVEAVAAAASGDPASDTVEFTQEVLDNGLKPEKHDIAINRWGASIKRPGADEDAEGLSLVSGDRLRDDESD